MTNVADHMRLGPERHIAALDRSLASTVYDNVFGGDTSDNVSLRRDDERSAMQITLYLAIDLNQSICGDMSYNFESVADDCSTALRSEHRFLLTQLSPERPKYYPSKRN